MQHTPSKMYAVNGVPAYYVGTVALFEVFRDVVTNVESRYHPDSLPDIAELSQTNASKPGGK